MVNIIFFPSCLDLHCWGCILSCILRRKSRYRLTFSGNNLASLLLLKKHTKINKNVTKLIIRYLVFQNSVGTNQWHRSLFLKGFLLARFIYFAWDRLGKVFPFNFSFFHYFLLVLCVKFLLKGINICCPYGHLSVIEWAGHIPDHDTNLR